MKSKQDNIQDLSNALQSANWQALKQALVGRELLAFGAELMYQTESIIESLQRPLYINTASFNEIIAAAFLNDISLDLVTPSTVKVNIFTQGTVYYKPFDIRLESGNIIYTNIDFTTSDQVITLYQGIPTSISNFDTSIKDLTTLSCPVKGKWDLYTEYTNSPTYSKYIKLPKEVMSKSIRVFTEVGTVYPLTEYNYELESESANLYKARIGRDNKPIVIFGNGVWGKFNALVDNIQLYYLQSTYHDCDVSQIKNIIIKKQPLDNTHFTILASTKGREVTLEDLRKQYKGGLSTPLVTEPQIRNYVNQFSSVSDCSPVHANGLVTVYIKPADINDNQFGDIQERLSVNGNFLQFQCVAANPYNFDILIKPYGAVSLNTQIQIVTEIQNLLRYDLLKFDTQISIQMLNEVMQKYSISASISLQIKEMLETLPYQMSTVPAKNTIKFRKPGFLAWDSAGTIVGTVTSATPWHNTKPIQLVNDFVLCLGNRALNITNDITSSIEAVFPIGYDNVIKSKDYIIFVQVGTPPSPHLMYFYHNDETFKDGPTSIQTLNYVRREPFKVVKSSAHIFNNPVIDGTDLYIAAYIDIAGNYTLSLLKYNIINIAGQDEYMQVHGYTINITPYPNNTDGVYSYISGDHIILITKNKSILVSNYKTNPTPKEVEIIAPGMSASDVITMLGTIIEIKYNLDTDEMLISTSTGIFYGKAPVPVFGSDSIFIDRLKKLNNDSLNVKGTFLLGISRGKAFYYKFTGMKSVDIQTAEVVEYPTGYFPQEIQTIGSIDYISKKVISTNQDLLETEITYETNDTKIDITPTKYPNLNNVTWI